MAVGYVNRDRHVGGHLKEGHDRDPLHAPGHVVAFGLAQPVRFGEQQINVPPRDRVGCVLQIHRPRIAPRIRRSAQVLGAGREADVLALVVDGQPHRGALVAVAGEVFPDRVVERRPGEQRAVGAGDEVVERQERRLTAERAEAFAEHDEFGPLPLGPLLDHRVDRLEQRLPGLTRVLLVHQERQPAGQEGVLHAHYRGVAVVHVLQRRGFGLVDPAGTGGGGDGDNRAIKSAFST